MLGYLAIVRLPGCLAVWVVLCASAQRVFVGFPSGCDSMAGSRALNSALFFSTAAFSFWFVCFVWEARSGMSGGRRGELRGDLGAQPRDRAELDLRTAERAKEGADC